MSPSHKSVPVHNRLSRKEIKKPMHAVHAFFNYANLPQAKEYLWTWLKATVAGTYSKDLDRTERADLLYFYEQLEKLIEAAHLLHESISAEQDTV